nr:LuxR family transcriptional regulator [Catenulispora sp.]
MFTPEIDLPQHRSVHTGRPAVRHHENGAAGRTRQPAADQANPSLVEGSEYGDVFLSIVDRTGAGLAVLDPRLRVQEHNAAFREHCGEPPFDLRDRDFSDLLHPSVRQHMLRRFDRLLHGGNSRFVEHGAVLWAARASFTGTLTGAAVRGEGDQIKTVVVLVTPDDNADDRRILVSPNKIMAQIDARILEGVATGASTVQLATKLYLSRQGIEYHVSGMLRKFRAPNRAALVSKAYSMGVFGVGSWPPKVLPEFIQN